MPLTEIYFSRLLFEYLFPRSGQFVGPTSCQINTALSATVAVLYPIHYVFDLFDLFIFYFVTLNSQILLECSDISIKLIWVPIMYVVVMTYFWIGRSWTFLYNCGIVVLHVFTPFLGGSHCVFFMDCTVGLH